MVEELMAAGWTHYEVDKGSDDFYRGKFRSSSFRGIPTQELENVDDFATFISDRSMLNVPPGVTCVVIVTRKSNLAELIQRSRQGPNPVEGSE